MRGTSDNVRGKNFEENLAISKISTQIFVGRESNEKVRHFVLGTIWSNSQAD